jgi:hypothetical protein
MRVVTNVRAYTHYPVLCISLHTTLQLGLYLLHELLSCKNNTEFVQTALNFFSRYMLCVHSFQQKVYSAPQISLFRGKRDMLKTSLFILRTIETSVELS